jgi:hypothetical protein
MNCDESSNPATAFSKDEREILEKQITCERIEEDVRRYSESLTSRHVGHSQNRLAVAQLLIDLYQIGEKGRLWLRPQLFPLFKDQELPQAMNVEAMLSGMKSSDVVIVSAHLDCTASRDPAYRPKRDPAPGADDDASGIAGVLAAARAIVQLSKIHGRGQPRAEIRFALFNAEELGQRGSRVYTRQEKRRCTSIVAVYQMDMIGHRRNGGVFEIHAGFKKDAEVQDDSLELAHHMVEVCAAMESQLIPQVYFRRGKRRDPAQGFSDHTSFHRRGFPAVLITENFFPGPGSVSSPSYPNPDYHLPEDTLKNLDFQYAADIARMVAATAWHRATRINSRPRQADEQHRDACGGDMHVQRTAAEEGHEAPLDEGTADSSHSSPGHLVGHG